MNGLTWKEFKDAVEALGVTDDTEMGFVDVPGSYMPQIHGGSDPRHYACISGHPPKDDDDLEVGL